MKWITMLIKPVFATALIFAILPVTAVQAQVKKSEAPKKTETAKSSIPAGYGSVTWGTLLSKARKDITGKLAFTDERTQIISRDGHLEYHYGFFYVDPAVVSAETADTAKDKKDKNEGIADEGTLFFVSLKFPYLSMKEVRKKLEDRFGPSTNENIVKNQGAIAWDSEKTLVVMWIDRYRNNPYCRRITYLSKDTVKQLNEYTGRMFSKVELDLIKKLNP